jgi:hypothetical protein
VKTLLETNQAIPDFLVEHIPEGFVPGEGDVNTLKFEMDSDDGGDAGEGGDAFGEAAGGGAWGTTDDAAASGGGWGAGGESTTPAVWG